VRATPPGQTVRLGDGRRLGYAEWGDPRGAPVLHFHGGRSCRLDRWGDESAYAELGVRLITTDRPGIGLSDPHPGRGLLDWPADVAALADALGIDRFAVVGYSVGGAYAAACARAMPDRLTGAAIVSGVAFLDRPGATSELGTSGHWAMARRAPRLLARAHGLAARVAARFPDLARRAFLWGLPALDRAVAARPEVGPRLIGEFVEAARPGARGIVDDMRVLMAPWGFRGEDIATRVHLWHGEADEVVPAVQGRRYAREIPDCAATFCEGEGHLLIEDRFEEVLRAVTSDADRRATTSAGDGEPPTIG
jgi:pimeloyl-ACP methyl ester carboxylesterase